MFVNLYNTLVNMQHLLVSFRNDTLCVKELIILNSNLLQKILFIDVEFVRPIIRARLMCETRGTTV